MASREEEEAKAMSAFVEAAQVLTGEFDWSRDNLIDEIKSVIE